MTQPELFPFKHGASYSGQAPSHTAKTGNIEWEVGTEGIKQESQVKGNEEEFLF